MELHNQCRLGVASTSDARHLECESRGVRVVQSENSTKGVDMNEGNGFQWQPKGKSE